MKFESDITPYKRPSVLECGWPYRRRIEIVQVRLTKLTQLNLDGTNVTDVSALRELKNLKISGPKI